MPRLYARLGVALVTLAMGCGARRAGSNPEATTADASATLRGSPTGRTADDPVAIDLLAAWSEGGIDSDGPVIDLGEAQGRTWLVGPSALPTTVLNGDSWVSVAQRIRFRVALQPDDGTDREGHPRPLPSALRMRVRRCTSRFVAVIVDGLLVRTATLPANGAVGVVTVPIPPDRFTRDVAEVELRFGVARTKPGQRSPIAAELDWVQLSRAGVRAVRATDLVHDVPLERTPRRALTFFAPTVLSTVRLLPAGARLRASIGAEAPRGSARPPAPAVVRLRAETDGETAVERTFTLAPNEAFQDVVIPLEAWGGRSVRLSIAALEGGEARVAVADPRVERGASQAPQRAHEIRNAVVLVLRGARSDRFFPNLSRRFAADGFARMEREGARSEAIAPSGREWSALVSAVTGIPADLHRVVLPTDYLDDAAATLASRLSLLGVSTRLFTDDPSLLGSGADRGFSVREGCPTTMPSCRGEAVIAAATEAISYSRGGRSLTVIAVRGGVLPLDPSTESVRALDPQPYEGTMTPMQTGSLVTRARHGAIRLDAADAERLGLLYDAVLVGIDHAFGVYLARMREVVPDGESLVLVVGNRGTALGEGGTVGDGPSCVRAVSTTVVLARGPGIPVGQRFPGVVGVLDASATVLEAFGAEVPRGVDGRSLLSSGALTERSLVLVANARGEIGMRFGRLLAFPRPALLGGGLSLIDTDADPLGVEDLSPQRPIARHFAEGILAQTRGSEDRRPFTPSTRVLP